MGSGGERLGVLRIGLKIPADREIGVQETIAAKLAKSFAIKCAALLRGNRSAELTALLADIRGRRDVVYALIVGNNGRTLAASANNYAGVRIPADPEPTALVGAMVGADATLSTYVDEVIGKEILEVATPFKLHVGRSGGTIRLGLSTDSFTGLDRRIGVLVGLMTVSLMALVALVARGVRREIAVPIDRLIADTAAIAMGRLDKPVAVTQEGEIGQLATAFESMRVSLQHRVKEIATRAMAMEGELGLFALPDLIQMIASSEQSGVLELSNGSSRGQVVIVNGDIAHAVLGQAQGVSAIEEMFAWDDGQFKFTPTVYTGPRTITKSWQELLVDSARRLDEARRAKEMFPNPDMQLCGSRTPSEETIFRLTVDESRVLALVAGGATVRSVVLEAELGEPETYAILRRLVLVGLIEVVAVPASEEA
ncbi:MAG: DUF4388 domain-containing protein [Candidatus Schekmanbacteria bacterium]|nr:DUF4388 domain-containing protein [Candidatus Schekmanbacteria bacterium]